MARDEKGRFLKGNQEGINSPIRNGLASEMQARSVAARKENQTLADCLRKQLSEKAASGSPMTKLEFLVAKALENHSKGSLSLKDLTYLQRLLGEDVLNIKTDGPQVIVVSEKSVKAADKWSKKEAE